MKVLEVLDQLAETPSTNDKLVLLYENESVSGLKDTFRLAYSTQIRFWIKKRPEASQFENGKRIDLSLALQLLEENIASRKMTGNLAIEYVGGLLALLDDDDKEVLCRVIDRDLKCGTGTSLANKIWKGLIPDYPVLLCNKFNEKTEKKVDWSIGQILQTKMDSSRINFEFYQGKVISVTTRNGSTIDITPFEDITVDNQEHFILDGELMCSKDGKDLDRKTSSGIINKAIKGTISKEESELLNLVTWDIIPYDDFIKGECLIKYSDRLVQLQKVVGKNTNRIKIVKSKVIYSKTEAFEQYNENLAKGLEGCILKNPNATWSSKRSNDYLKLKNESTADLRVIGYDMGTVGSQFEGMLGCLICETSDGLLQVRVGSGFKHLKGERDDPEFYVGKIVEVKYNEVISNKSSTIKSLFLPIFSCVRFDKDIANTLEELL